MTTQTNASELNAGQSLEVERLMGLLIATPGVITTGNGIVIDGQCRKVDMKMLRSEVIGSYITAQPEPADAPQQPAVPVKKSITPDFIICLEDGQKFKSLKRHLRTHYNMSPEEYRAKWGLPTDYPMVAPNYSATRSALAKDHGLGTKK